MITCIPYYFWCWHQRLENLLGFFFIEHFRLKTRRTIRRPLVVYQSSSLCYFWHCCCLPTRSVVFDASFPSIIPRHLLVVTTVVRFWSYESKIMRRLPKNCWFPFNFIPRRRFNWYCTSPFRWGLYVFAAILVVLNKIVKIMMAKKQKADLLLLTIFLWSWTLLHSYEMCMCTVTSRCVLIQYLLFQPQNCARNGNKNASGPAKEA